MLGRKRRHGNETVSGTQLQERALGVLGDFLLGILRFRIIELPCRDAELLKPGLVGDLVGLAVADDLCHFFTCHHIIVVLPTKIGRLLQVSMTWLTGWLQCIYKTKELSIQHSKLIDANGGMSESLQHLNKTN